MLRGSLRLLRYSTYDTLYGSSLEHIRTVVDPMADAAPAVAEPVVGAGFAETKHKAFIRALEKQQGTYETVVTEQYRMSGVYWGLCAMATLRSEGELDTTRIVDFVQSSRNSDGGCKPRGALAPIAMVHVLECFCTSQTAAVRGTTHTCSTR